MITCVTPTGDRELCLNLLVRWVTNQTVRPDQWLIIDDGKIPYRPKWFDTSATPITYVRREPQANDPKHTLNLNMITALPHIRGDKILIMEDDEYYAPRYVEEMSHKLNNYEIAGIGWSKYYHVPSRGYVRHANVRHASFAQTAFRRSVLSVLNECAKQSNIHYLDIRLWRRYGGEISACTNREKGWEQKVGSTGLIFDDSHVSLYAGMKGLPGRDGIGIGHKTGMYKKHDKDFSVLKQWVPSDYEIYERLGS